MNFVVGLIMIAASAALWLKYKPQTQQSRGLCLLCCLMGVMSIVVTGGKLPLQAVQALAQAVVLSCSIVHLHREKVFFTRRRAKLTKRGPQKPREISLQVCA